MSLLRIALISAVLIGPAFAQSEKDQSGIKQPEAQVSKQERPAEIRGTDQFPFSVKIIPAEKTKSEREEETREHREKAETDRKLADYTGELAFFTKGLFIATVILGIATIGLLVAAFFQSRDMKASIGIAHRAATAAERSLVDLQRAMIVPVRFTNEQMVRDGIIIAYRITALLENTGNTVAKKLTGTSNILVVPEGLPDDFAYPDHIGVESTKAGYAGPHVQNPHGIIIALQDLLDIMNGLKRGFIYGWVEYEDIFSPGIKRRTEYCAEFRVIGNPLLPRMGQVGQVAPTSTMEFGAYSNRYNGLDDDCLYKPGERPPVGGLPPPTQP